jgi:predicted 3-demethylubiquinone-9 3-methyltransferase (glyoxalase superfamily)
LCTRSLGTVAPPRHENSDLMNLRPIEKEHPTMTTITPFLWFDNDLEEAIELYTSLFPDAKVHGINRKSDGSAFSAEFELAGQRFNALNGGPDFTFNEAISLFVACDGQEEVDRYWNALTADGGEESRCGWLKDKYGLSWQIVPNEFVRMLSDGTPEQVERVTGAMMTMAKLDVAALQAAFDG